MGSPRRVGVCLPHGGLIKGWLLEGDEVDGGREVEGCGWGGQLECRFVEVFPTPPETS